MKPINLRRLFIVAVLLMLSLLVSCQDGETPTPPPEEGTPQSEVTTTPKSSATPISSPTPDTPFPPLVLQTSPERGEEQGLTDPIEIAFDQKMNQASVEAAFNINPTLEGELTWVNDTTLRFVPGEDYQRGQRYEVTIADTAENEDGLPLNRSLELPFNIVGFLEVSSVQPQDETTEVAPFTTVTILFNRPVVSLTAIEDLDTLPNPITFEPAVSGTGEWLNTSIYQFTPAEGFASATTYTARVDSDLTDTAGGAMTADFTWTFTTASPQVIATYPEDDRLYVSPTTVISVAFSQLMNRESVEEAFTMQNGESKEIVEGTFTWVEAGLTQPRDPYDDYYYYDYEYDDGAGPQAVGVETLAFTPDSPLERGGMYEVIIADAAKGRQGNEANLTNEYSFTFIAISNLAIRRSYPEDGATQIAPYSSLEVTFNAPVDPTSVKIGENFIIGPNISPTQVYSYFWDSNTQMNINFPSDASTAYTATIGGDITDRYGRPMGEDVTIRWETSPYGPHLYLHSPGFIGTYSAYTSTMAYVSVRNISGANFNLYQLPQDDFIQLNGEDRWDYQQQFFPDEDDLIRTWQIETDPDLNDTLIYSTNLAGEEEGILDPGLYYLTIDIDSDQVYPATKDINPTPNIEQILVVGNHNLSIKTSSNQSMAWLTDLRSTESIEGATVTFYDQSGQALGKGETDEQGVTIVEHNPVETWQPRFAISENPFAVTISEWSSGVERWNYGISIEDYLTPYNSYFYTDRAIYRPGQTVYFKGIIRADDDAHYTLPPSDEPVMITIYDSQGKEIYNDEYILNENGSINGEIMLAGEAALGYYVIEAYYEDQYFSKDFQVAEYRKPEFIVEVTTDKPEYVNGETIDLTAQATYFFGGPVTNANVTYNILSGDYFFNYDGPGVYYDFTDYDYSRAREGNFFGGFGELIMSGDSTTDAKGMFTLEVAADIAERLASQNYTLEVVVTDSESNQVVANQAQAIVHKGNYYIGLRPEQYVATVGDETEVNIITVDWDSLPVSKVDLDIVVYEHNWYSIQKQGEDGQYYWESTVEDIPVYTTTTTTGPQGKSIVTFSPKSGGVHKIEAKGTDEDGNSIRSSTFIWISGNDYINWRQENNDRLDLVTDKKEYNVGDVATILIPHPYSGTVTALVTQERGHIYNYDVIQLPTNSEQLEIPITADMLPNMFISVVIVKGPGDGEPIPSFKVGYAQLPISVEEKEINITLTPDKPVGESYQPRDEVTYNIMATDIDGNPVEAEISLALVDKAILTLADDTGETILQRFWRERGLGVGTATTLAISAERINLAVAPEAKGGGGGFDDSFGIIRGEFKDTAYWLADFSTDVAGEGSITAKLPDNLTTWVLTARGITKETLVGDSRVEIVSTKPVLVRPVTPRFFVVGDEAELKMIVQNNSKETIIVDTLFEGEGVSLMADGEAEGRLEIEAGTNATILYPVKVGPDASEAILRFGAAGGIYEDAVELTLPIHRNSTPETVGTSGVLAEDGLRLEGIALPRSFDSQQGNLTVNIEPSLAASMRGGLNYLEHFPYECTEQTVSRFLPNVFTYRAYEALKLDNPDLAEKLPNLVSVGLQRLYAQQHVDGGWGWWSQDESQPFLSAYVLLGLIEAQKADFAVETQVLEDGLNFLQRSLLRPNDVEASWEANQQAFILYVLAEGDAGDLSRSVSLFDQREKLDLFGRAYLALTFALIDEDDSRVQTLLGDITNEAIVSATGTHWEEATPDYYSMNTDTRSTAIIIATLSRLDPENALLPNAIRWLMSVRQDDHWETTQESAWAIIGLTDWMVASGELEGNYAWSITLNNDTLGEGSVSPATIEKVTTLTVAVKDLLANEVNRMVIERAPQTDAAESLGQLYYTAHLRYYKPVEEVEALDRGIIVAREYTLADDKSSEAISEAKVGDIVNVKITLIAPHDLHYVKVEDPIPAGSEAIDVSLDTTSVVNEGPQLDRTDRGGWGWWWFSHTELRDEKAVLFATYLPAGTYEYTYQIRPSLAGEYRVIPTHAEEMYFPEVFGRGDGMVFTISE